MNNTLDKANLGERVQILKLTGSRLLKMRFIEMGILPGAFVTVVRTAPLGCPLEIKVKGARILLRRREAALIKIERIIGKK